LKGVRSGVERRRGVSGLKARDPGRRETPGDKVLKKQRSPRERGRMGTSVKTLERAFWRHPPARMILPPDHLLHVRVERPPPRPRRLGLLLAAPPEHGEVVPAREIQRGLDAPRYLSLRPREPHDVQRADVRDDVADAIVPRASVQSRPSHPRDGAGVRAHAERHGSRDSSATSRHAALTRAKTPRSSASKAPPSRTCVANTSVAPRRLRKSRNAHDDDDDASATAVHASNSRLPSSSSRIVAARFTRGSQ
jgi:hypothetical protein